MTEQKQDDAAKTAQDQAAAEAKAKEEQAARERDAATIKEAEVRAAQTPTDPARINVADQTEIVQQQVEAQERLNAERDDQNTEGHEKNLARNREEAELAHARTEHAHDRRANHVPTGKQNNNNTPTVLKDGSKVWK